MAGNRNQEVGIIGKNISMLLYTTFVMSVGIGFLRVKFTFKNEIFVRKNV